MDASFRGEAGAGNRRFPRKRLRLAVQYKRLERNRLPSAVESRLEDLGAGGMAMTSGQRLAPDQLLMITLYLPAAPICAARGEPLLSDRDCTPVNILSRVAWCAERTPRSWVCGVQFLDCDRTDRTRLKHFLVEFDLDSPNSQLYQ